jgi:hypothetical protein
MFTFSYASGDISAVDHSLVVMEALRNDVCGSSSPEGTSRTMLQAPTPPTKNASQ